MADRGLGHVPFHPRSWLKSRAGPNQPRPLGVKMRQKLIEIRKERKDRDQFRSVLKHIETIYWTLRNMNTSISSSSSSSGSSFDVPSVPVLPPISDTGYQKVFWTSADGGSGDNQTWDTYTGQTRWYPCQKPTTLSGVPGS